MRFRTVAAAFLALSLVAPAMAAGECQMPVDQRFGGGSLTFPGYGKGYVYRMLLSDQQGQIAVCGAGYF